MWGAGHVFCPGLRAAFHPLGEQARAQAEAQAKEAMAQAESRAARRTEEILAEKRSDCDALRSAARERLPAAVELIVGRVVSI